jgi:hypothetical protein
MAGTVKVKVSEGWAVCVDDQQHSGGDVVEVPADLAEEWTMAGWVQPVKPAPRRAGRTLDDNGDHDRGGHGVVPTGPHGSCGATTGEPISFSSARKPRAVSTAPLATGMPTTP